MWPSVMYNVKAAWPHTLILVSIAMYLWLQQAPWLSTQTYISVVLKFLTVKTTGRVVASQIAYPADI